MELVTGMGLMALLVLGSLTLMIGSMRSLQRTDNDTTMSDQNARALRKITENIRQAVSVSASTDGKTLTYNLPALAASADPVTGEHEVAMPPVSDGTTRTYVVNFTAGTLVDGQTGKVMVRNIYGKDTDPTSSLYNQAYLPFQISSIDVCKAVTINLVTRDVTSGQARTTRMKTTAILRNAP